MGWVRAEIDDGVAGVRSGLGWSSTWLDRGWGRALLAGVRRGQWRRPVFSFSSVEEAVGDCDLFSSVEEAAGDCNSFSSVKVGAQRRNWVPRSITSYRGNSGDRIPTVGKIPVTGFRRPVTGVGVQDFLWEDSLYGSEITKLDLLEVIMDKAVTCNVIDCFGAIIADEISQQDSQSVVVPRVMQTMTWATMVELWMTAVKEQGDEMLKKGCRRKMDMNMSSSEKLTNTSATSHIVSFKIFQFRFKVMVRLDCGIFIMYYMDKISKEKTFDITLKKEDVLKFRAQVVKRFLDHMHS
ncbi:hypothetical protein ACLB2K_073073 [Fragaria x ananassa]